MRAKLLGLMFFAGLIVIGTIYIQGCATAEKSSIHPQARETMLLSPLVLVRYETPTVELHTRGRAFVGGLAEGAIFSAIPVTGIIPGIIYGRTSGALATGKIKKEEIPDFGQLIMETFTVRAPKEIPDWPTMIVEPQPIKKKIIKPSGTILEFKIKTISLTDTGGLCVYTTTTMTDSHGQVLWERGFGYSSNSFGKKRSIKEYNAENWKLLKEEIEFAANQTVSEFITHFKEVN